MSVGEDAWGKVLVDYGVIQDQRNENDLRPKVLLAVRKRGGGSPTLTFQWREGRKAHFNEVAASAETFQKMEAAIWDVRDRVRAMGLPETEIAGAFE